MSRILCLAIIWFLLLGTLSVSHSASNRASDRGESLVFEPIFQSDVYICEMGRGHSKSIVMIHGVGDLGSKIWDHIIPQLAKKYHVVTFDLPGFGRSGKGNRLYSPTLYAAFIKWVVDQYVKGPFVLIGHSLGGAVALRFASVYPVHLEHLVLIDVAGILHYLVLTKYMAYLKIKNWSSGLTSSPLNLLNKLTGYTIDRLTRLPIDPETVLGSAVLRKKILSASPSKIAGLALVNEDFSKLIHQIQVPTLILWGSKDTVTPLRTGKLLAANMPNAVLKLIPDVGHTAMLEKPEVFNRLLISELSRPSGQQRQPIKPVASDRIGICNAKSGMLFTGAYKRIEVRDSRQVRLLNVTAESLIVSKSEVDIENSLIMGHDFALKLDDSVLSATAVKMKGDIAILASKSRLDLAGVELHGRNAAVRSDGGSTFLFSVSRVKSPHMSDYVHGMQDVSVDNPL